MFDLAPLLVSVFGGGGAIGGIKAVQWITDERARRHAEKAAAVRAPLEQRSYELRIAAQADEVFQDTIKTLRENLRDLKGDFAQYKRDTEDQRRRDIEEHQRQRKLDHDELDRARAEIEELNQRIADQDATITQLKFELQGYRSGPGP